MTATTTATPLVPQTKRRRALKLINESTQAAYVYPEGGDATHGFPLPQNVPVDFLEILGYNVTDAWFAITTTGTAKIDGIESLESE